MNAKEYGEFQERLSIYTMEEYEYDLVRQAYNDEQARLKELGIETLIYEPRDCGIVLRAFMSKAQLLAYPYDDRFGYVFMWDAYNEDLHIKLFDYYMESYDKTPAYLTTIFKGLKEIFGNLCYQVCSVGTVDVMVVTRINEVV